MRIFAGCDGGGTKCLVRVVVCDDSGAIVAEGHGVSGPANVRSNPDLAQASIIAATTEALKSVSLPSDTPKVRMVAALAGAGDSAMQTAWTTSLQMVLPFQHVEVVPDPAILFAAAGVEGQAVASIVGTGSIAWARDVEGEVKRAGGLGPKVGDEGSAFWIGLQGAQRIANVTTEENALRDFLLRKLQCSHVESLSQRIANRDFETRDVAELAPMIFELASNGSKLAKKIISEAEEQIAKLLVEATTSFQTLPDFSDAELPWVAAGGVAVNQPKFMNAVRQLCNAKHVLLAEPKIVRKPVDGAVLLAMRGDG